VIKKVWRPPAYATVSLLLILCPHRWIKGSVVLHLCFVKDYAYQWDLHTHLPGTMPIFGAVTSDPFQQHAPEVSLHLCQNTTYGCPLPSLFASYRLVAMRDGGYYTTRSAHALLSTNVQGIQPK
jgi:hypothetical protein